jgi:hypothetical protein
MHRTALDPQRNAIERDDSGKGLADVSDLEEAVGRGVSGGALHARVQCLPR